MIPDSAGGVAGYSVIEVLAAIVVLTVAILPMVGMFDAALGGTGASRDYDAARACANDTLERTRALPYETVRAGLPDGACERPGFGYAVDEGFVDAGLQSVETDEGLLRLTVTVSWRDGGSYDATGVVSRW